MKLPFFLSVVALVVFSTSSSPLEFSPLPTRAADESQATAWIDTTSLPEDDDDTAEVITQRSSNSLEVITLTGDDQDVNVQMKAYFSSLSQKQLDEYEAILLREYPTTRGSCSIWSLDIWKCLTELFFSKSSNSIAKWFLDAVGGSKEMSSMMMDIVKTCGKKAAKDVLPSLVWDTASKWMQFEEPGPYDVLICELLDAVRTGSASEIGLLGVKDCVDKEGQPLAQDCMDTFVGGGSKLEMLKTIFSAVTGWGGSDIGTPENIVEEIAVNYKSCKAEQSSSTLKCLTYSFVESTCSGICKAATCQMEEYQQSNSTACRKAVKSGCSALFATAETLCKATTSSIDGDVKFPHKACDRNCRSSAFSTHSSIGLSLILSSVFLVHL